MIKYQYIQWEETKSFTNWSSHEAIEDIYPFDDIYWMVFCSHWTNLQIKSRAYLDIPDSISIVHKSLNETHTNKTWISNMIQM